MITTDTNLDQIKNESTGTNDVVELRYLLWFDQFITYLCKVTISLVGTQIKKIYLNQNLNAAVIVLRRFDIKKFEK